MSKQYITPIVGDVYSDTKSNILGSTLPNNTLAFANDTEELFFKISGTWYMIPFNSVVKANTPDMGGIQDSSRIGYGTTYISDKAINFCTIGANGNPVRGGFRVITVNGNDELQVYINGAWQTVVNGLTLIDDAIFGYTFGTIPDTGTLGYYLEAMTGDSLLNVGLNGLPITQAYKTSMGAYPPVATIGGRTI